MKTMTELKKYKIKQVSNCIDDARCFLNLAAQNIVVAGTGIKEVVAWIGSTELEYIAKQCLAEKKLIDRAIEGIACINNAGMIDEIKAINQRNDRASIRMKESDGKEVVFYTHCKGSELPETLRSALIRGKSRWEDEQYLARIIFCEMVKGSEMEQTGFGISTYVWDGEDRIIDVSCEEMSVTLPSGVKLMFDQYIALSPASWDSTV